jgi:protoporphyrinogen oxidase
MMTLRARAVRDWRKLEQITARDWLIGIGGREVYEVVWEPLLRGKFGRYAEQISAVWFWNKLNLRGGSRDRSGKEKLVYFRGGFLTLAQALAREIERIDGTILTDTPAIGIEMSGERPRGVITPHGLVNASTVIATPALPIIAGILEPHLPGDYVAGLREIEYLANICLVLELDRSLSDTYWLNVNDPSFPFVGVIEHTNLEDAATYRGRHIVYLSKYLPRDDDLYRLSDAEFLRYALPYLRRMFPRFDESWIQDYKAWRADYAQPIVGLNYSRKIPDIKGPVPGLYIATMAQIYPEDRGTNYAVRQGREIAAIVSNDINRYRPHFHATR